jgi:uncharacterized RmlC-like cupin family protein
VIRIDKIQTNLIRVVTDTAQVWFSHELPVAYATKAGDLVLRDPGVSTTTRRHQRLIDPAAAASVSSVFEFEYALNLIAKGA